MTVFSEIYGTYFRITAKILEKNIINEKEIRDIILENWNDIKEKTEKSKIYECTYKNLHIKAIDKVLQIELILIKTVNKRIIISKKAKIMTFKYLK